MDKKRKKEAAESLWGNLPPEMLLEILSRVPYRSLCRFKCASKEWTKLCSDPAVRRRPPQTLSGFFCYSRVDVGDGQRLYRLDFLNMSGWGRPLVDDPSLGFVREHGGYCDVTPVHCCGGILLCYCEKVAMRDDGNYVVCNPATKEIWAMLPVPPNKFMDLNKAFLCFDPAAPHRFVLFVFVQTYDGIQTVEVYSSDTGRWTSMRSKWNPKTLLLGDHSQCIFFNGASHLADYEYSTEYSAEFGRKRIHWMVTVDTEGKTWRRIKMPAGFILQSQGRIYVMRVETEGRCRLLVWVLEDYARGKWTLKCTASMLDLHSREPHLYTPIAVHPECSLIFLVGAAASHEKTLMSYDMDTSKLNIVCTLGDRQSIEFQPYIPCFAEKPSVTS